MKLKCENKRYLISGVRAADTVGRIILADIFTNSRLKFSVKRALVNMTVYKRPCFCLTATWKRVQPRHPSLWKHAVGGTHLDERHASDSSHLVAR